MIRSCRRLSIVLAATLALLVAGCGAGTAETPMVLATLHIDPTPTPSPKPPSAGQLALDAFVKRVTSGKLTYHATLKGEAVGAVNGLQISGGVDVGGGDYAETASYTFSTSPKVAILVRAVGSLKWIKVAGGRWQKISAAGSNSPFTGVAAPADVRLLRTERVAGHNRHHLQFAGGQIIAPDQIPAENLTEERVTSTRTELIVDDSGVPLTATWQLDGVGRVSGQLQGIRVNLVLSFTKVGSKIVIKAP